MKRILTVLIALALVALTGLSALAETAGDAATEAVEQAATETADAVEEAATETAEAVEQAAQVQVHQLLTWADRYDRASVEEKHIIISHLVEKVEVGEGYQITIQFKVAAESLVRKSA